MSASSLHGWRSGPDDELKEFGDTSTKGPAEAAFAAQRQLSPMPRTSCAVRSAAP
jgi:hypothetical protein